MRRPADVAVVEARPPGSRARRAASQNSSGQLWSCCPSPATSTSGSPPRPRSPRRRREIPRPTSTIFSVTNGLPSTRIGLASADSAAGPSCRARPRDRRLPGALAMPRECHRSSVSVVGSSVEVPQHRAQHDVHLHVRERRTDAAPGATAERDPVVQVGPRADEPAGVEPARASGNTASSLWISAMLTSIACPFGTVHGPSSMASAFTLPADHVDHRPGALHLDDRGLAEPLPARVDLGDQVGAARPGGGAAAPPPRRASSRSSRARRRAGSAAGRRSRCRVMPVPSS